MLLMPRALPHEELLRVPLWRLLCELFPPRWKKLRPELPFCGCVVVLLLRPRDVFELFPEGGVALPELLPRPLFVPRLLLLPGYVEFWLLPRLLPGLYPLRLSERDGFCRLFHPF